MADTLVCSVFASLNAGERFQLQSEAKRVGYVCFVLETKKETDAVFEELSAIYPVKKLQSMYEEATADRFCFMYVNMLASNKRDMFFKNFDYRMLP